MLIPSNRMIFWTALIVLPSTTLMALAPGGVIPLAAVLVAFAVTVAADAMRAGRAFDGIRVELPELIRLQKDRAGQIDVLIHNERASASLLRIGFLLPEGFEPGEGDRTVMLPASSPDSRTEIPCTAATRGQYFLKEAQLEAASPLGFWLVRKTQPCRGEVRVYPNLFDERRKVAALFLRQAQAGVHAQRQAGQGRDFEKLRNYLPGDSLGDIHWKASAKRGEAVTKVYQIERTHEVYVAIDASRLSARLIEAGDPATTAGGEAEKPKTALERFVTSALILGLAAEKQGDQFGLITFSDRILDFVRARSGKAHFDACRDCLYTLQPQGVSPDFEELCSFIRLRQRKRALIIILTALDDPVLAESFTKAAELIARQHLVLVNVLKPAEVAPLFTETLPVRELDDVYRRLGGHLQWRGMRDLQKVLQRRGIRFSMLDAGKLSAEVVAQHAEIRARQLQ